MYMMCLEFASIPNERDRYKCVLTKFVYGLDVSHIVPLKANKTAIKEQEQEWTWLGLFWSKERVDKSREAIVTGKSHEARMVIQRLENLISFNAPVHIFWGDALCALHPIVINEDKTYMEVAFH
ncbi:unnamed protein product [Penicillium camemberti]|uniref:Str. FM013 n=1 Tax=Penicillium camemberti (strain FM 013) TaxID=1429867 RepID=A0A0G4PQH1_PENC3|nr:unnamed protein product [Penicillium camemberti]